MGSGFIFLVLAILTMALPLSSTTDSVQEQDDASTPFRWSNGVQVSLQDARQYKCITLPNALQVLLISDKDTDKAAAALDVGVGQMSDPEDIPGLAHFLEHMLFLGTEKYPDENSYSKFLSAHGGRSNAYTALENTNYYFDVNPYVAYCCMGFVCMCNPRALTSHPRLC